MAPKRLLQDPPAASSMEEDSDAETVDEEEEEVQNDVVEDEEDKSGDEEDDEDEEEDDEENVTANKKPNVPNPPSESASDAGSETESDVMTHSPTASDFTVKPIVSKPMNDSPAKPTKKTAAAAAPAKRAAESDPNLKDSKKKKKGSSGSGEDEETKKAGRLWGEDDEIAILEGMIEFKAKNGTDPSSNMGAFHEFLRRSLKADVNKNQLMDKARRLKKKYYLPNADKGENGEGPLFSKAHELKLVDLSNKIWGVEANGGGGGGGKNSKKKPRKSAKAVAVAVDISASPVLALPVSYLPAEKSAEKKVEKKAEMNNVANGGMEAESDEVFWSKYPFLRDSLRFGKWDGLEMVLMQGMPSIGSSKAKGLDDRWRKLQVLEMELVAKKLALEHEMTKFILDSMKSRKE